MLAAEQQEHSAAIAGHRQLNVSAFAVLAANIEDDPRNTTRFLVIGNQDVAPSGNDKTSLVMSAR